MKTINKILFFSRLIILLVDFILTLYIMMMLNTYSDGNIGSLVMTCLPLLLTLIVFVVSFFFKKGNNHLLFNVCSILSLITILIIDYRTICDKNMVMWVKSNMNFYYFKNQIGVIKTLCYTTFIGNILLLYIEKNKDKHI